MIRSIQLSDDDQWLLNSRVKRSRNNEIAGLQTSFSEENIFRKTRVLSKKPDEQVRFIFIISKFAIYDIKNILCYYEGNYKCIRK